MLRLAKKAVAGLLRRLGYDLRPVEVAPTMDAALARVDRRTAISTVIDVGASDGRWSRAAQRRFPRARYLLIEAQEQCHGAALRRFAATDPRVEVVLAAAGDRVGEISFDASDPFGGVAGSTAGHAVHVPMTTIDAEVTRLGLPAPFLVKLDTHGFEMPILEGARATLAQTEAIVIEAYNFEINDSALRFHELCERMEHIGFRCADLADPMWRPGDDLLWQFDLVFSPANRPEFARKSYVSP